MLTKLHIVEKGWKKHLLFFSPISTVATTWVTLWYYLHFLYWNPAGNYIFKVNNRNTITRCEICSKLTIKTPEWRYWLLSEVVSHLALVFLLLTLSRLMPVEKYQDFPKWLEIAHIIENMTNPRDIFQLITRYNLKIIPVYIMKDRGNGSAFKLHTWQHVLKFFST